MADPEQPGSDYEDNQPMTLLETIGNRSITFAQLAGTKGGKSSRRGGSPVVDGPVVIESYGAGAHDVIRTEVGEE